MAYVDGFVILVPTRNLKKYQAIARKAGKVWMQYGALQYMECVGDDMKNSWGVAFPKLAKVKRGESVIFSWIVYKSKKHRDAVNKKVMKDPRIQSLDPSGDAFDCKRMAYGGFKILVDA